MTKQDQLPEAAQKEPRILSPEEDQERAARAREESERRIARGERGVSPNPDEPLRQPGELSTPPANVPSEQR